jgi:hypothetical protein
LKLFTLRACAVALLLAACTPAPSEQSEAPAASAPVEANLAIGPGGAAGISDPLPFSVEAITAAAPGFFVAEARDRSDGRRVLTLSIDYNEVFRIYPSPDGARVFAIATRSTDARGPADETVNVTTYYQSQQAHAAEVAYCRAEAVEAVPGFACAATPEARFWRVYSLGADYDGPSQPFDAIDPDAAIDARMVELRWLAPQPG